MASPKLSVHVTKLSRFIDTLEKDVKNTRAELLAMKKQVDEREKAGLLKRLWRTLSRGE